MSAEPLLTVRGLGKSFGGVKAVDGIDFALAPGELRRNSEPSVLNSRPRSRTTPIPRCCASGSTGRVRAPIRSTLRHRH